MYYNVVLDSMMLIRVWKGRYLLFIIYVCVKCIMYYVLCITYYVLRIMYYVLYIMRCGIKKVFYLKIFLKFLERILK